MTTRLPAPLRDSLSDFLADNRDVPHKRHCLLTFLAEAMLCAESNLMQGDGFADVPALAAMLERLDEHLDFLVDSSEVRQQRCRYGEDQRRDSLSDEVFAWFDAPSLGAPDGVVDADLHRGLSGQPDALSGDNGRRW
tara:strand:- start:759 stop:1169 length:411 start_codon:yes stop_codon:yes gene_type:complete